MNIFSMKSAILQVAPDVNEIIQSTENIALKILIALLAVILIAGVGLFKIWYDNYKSDKQRAQRLEDEERESRRQHRKAVEDEIQRTATIVARIEKAVEELERDVQRNTGRIDELK